MPFTNILIEYALVLGTALIFLVLLPRWNRDVGTDNLLVLLIVSYGLQILTWGVAVFSYVINPVRVLIVCWKSLGEMHALLRIASMIIMVLPIPFMIPFGKRLYQLFYENKSTWGKVSGCYEKSAVDYKTPSQFREELKERGLFFDDTNVNGLGGPEAFAKPRQDGRPAYEYVAYLRLTEADGKLVYASSNLSDYYFECRIFYVDGDIYAVIGNSASDAVRQRFAPTDRPYCMILAEKESITTYVDGKYYSNGAIRVGNGPMEMLPQAEESTFSNYHPAIYPIQKVERLDLGTMNMIAAELQDMVR